MLPRSSVKHATPETCRGVSTSVLPHWVTSGAFYEVRPYTFWEETQSPSQNTQPEHPARTPSQNTQPEHSAALRPSWLNLLSYLLLSPHYSRTGSMLLWPRDMTSSWPLK